MTTSISVRLSPKIADQLDSIAKETERSKSFIIQKALEAYLEEYADLQIAWDRIHDLSDPLVTCTELRKSLGL
jgi:RHH-type rel operon transcriptional repressor/antitoxin RelB